jgi:uncharacterized repeat protein (TIGR01451 family)
VVVSLPSSAALNATLSDTATATTSTPDPTPADGNNTATLGSAVVGSADLSLALSGGPTNLTQGDTVTYTLSVTNHGPTDAAGLVLTDLPPAGAGFVSASPAFAGYNPATGTVNLGTLSSGAGVSGTLVFRVLLAGSLVNQASVSAGPTDPSPADDSQTLTLAVADFVPVVSLGADVSLGVGQTLSRAGSFVDPGADTWTATVNYGDGTGTQPLALNADKTFALGHRYTQAGTCTVTVNVSDGYATGTSSFVAHVLAPASVQSVVVNDGSAQRSMVTSLTVTFSTQVDIAPGAFTLVQTVGGVSTDVSGVLHVATTVTSDGRTVATLTFAGGGVTAGSLADGRYTLTIHAGLVTDHLLGMALDGDGDGLPGGDRVERFFRLFGDVNGDGKVNATDQTAFLAAYRSRQGMAAYRSYFDYNGDGLIDSTDYYQFQRRYGSAV